MRLAFPSEEQTRQAQDQTRPGRAAAAVSVSHVACSSALRRVTEQGQYVNGFNNNVARMSVVSL